MAEAEAASEYDCEGYYDIMILGRTGMGKTTTVDKILMANPTGHSYDYNATVEGIVTTNIPDRDEAIPHPQKGKSMCQRGMCTRGKLVSTIKTASKCNDLSMWHLSSEQDKNKVSKRLTKLVVCRSKEQPHKEIQELHEQSTTTKSCELLSNDTSKVRVLDVPGFYGPDEDEDSEDDSDLHPDSREPPGSLGSSVFDTHGAGLQTDLSIMRKILHIKIATNFKFNRIVYFLPDNGVLNRASRNLKTELQIMERYFKRTVFESMVVVATQNRSIYSKLREDCQIFTEDEMMKIQTVFGKAMRKVFQGSEAPKPPIIFISLNDTCDEVLRKIRDAQVFKEGVGLTFNPSTCARCGIHIGKLADPTDANETEGTEEVAIAIDELGSVAIPYDESTCHPALIPKFSRLQCIVGGIIHLMTLLTLRDKFKDILPYFGNEDEVCINCNEPPKSRGCMRVGTRFVHKRARDGIIVNHSSNVEENYVFDMDATDSIPRMRYGNDHIH